jgi:MoaA/NifB/PqqE/SkfB family radical SAM enzyme
MVYNLRTLKAYSRVIKNNFLNLVRFKVYPRAAHFILTWRCNLKCKSCSAWEKDGGDELNKDEIRRLFGKVKFLDILKITGGEPFIREDIISIIAAAKKIINPYVIQITTNGTYTDRIVECIKQTHFTHLHLRISLDGVGEVHDEIRGVKGCYDKVRETILTLIELRKRKKLTFRLGINYGLREDTIPFITEMFKFCKENDIDLILGYPVKPFLEDINFNFAEFSIETSNKTLEIYRAYINRQNPGNNFWESLVTNFLNKEFLRKKSLKNLKFDCRELKDLIYILPNGDVVICGLRQKKMFNLLKDDFRRNWFGKNIRYWREVVKNCPGCLQASVRILSRIYKIIPF